MKTERRHELQTNDLAKQLAQLIEGIKPYSSAIVLGTIVVLVILIGSAYFSKQSAEESAEAWDAYLVATEFDPFSGEDMQEKLNKAAKEYPDSVMEPWAQLVAADDGLRSGSRQLLMNKTLARKQINAAMSKYRILKSSADDVLRNQATFHLALGHEMLSQLDKAKEEYLQVRGVLQDLAVQRAEALERNKGIDEFYDWYAKAEPRGRFTPGLPGTPGSKPGFDINDPLIPDGPSGALDDPLLQLPKNIDDVKPAPEKGVTLPSFLDDVNKPAPAAQPVKPPEGKAPQPPAEGNSQPEAKPAAKAAPDKPASAPKENAGAASKKAE